LLFISSIVGEISVASELGQGSCFTVDIPCRDAAPISPKLESQQIIGYQGSRRKILIVDDEPLNRLMLNELLSIVGFDTADASTAKEAFTLLKDHVDAVISDIAGQARTKIRMHLLPGG
jgi:PleD family two-component response regulator